MKAELIMEFGGRQVSESDITKEAKTIWTNDGNKVSDIKSLDVYIKPEENMAYYVINCSHTGSFPI